MATAETSETWTIDDVFALADMIGEMIDHGHLPPKNEFGQYVL